MKVRCPICNGTGGVEPCFGTGYMMSPTDGYTSNVCAKQCPGCGGTGMQDVDEKTHYVYAPAFPIRWGYYPTHTGSAP